MNGPVPRRPEPPLDSPLDPPLEPTGTAFAAARLGRSRVPGLVWVIVLAAPAALGLGGRLLPASAASAPAASAPAPAVLTSTTERLDALARQCLEWERVYREIHPTTMTATERAYYAEWQRRYEQQHPQG